MKDFSRVKKIGKGACVSLLFFVFACGEKNEGQNVLTEDQSSFWYEGLAEISTYRLEQARYGEMRNGTVVQIFVSEDFSKRTKTKADVENNKNVSVLKSIRIKKFQTGIYDYSLMTSTFFPFEDGMNSLKTSMTSQEWCGHSYLEILDKGEFRINYDSYFQGEEVANKRLDPSFLEDDIYTWIRIRNTDLPQGNFRMIPSSEYLSLNHKKIHAYDCELTLERGDLNSTYSVYYPKLKRELKITFESAFPFKIQSWEETYAEKGKDQMTSKVEMLTTIRLDYWNKNKKSDERYREILDLDK